jgi:hypothetical protein
MPLAAAGCVHAPAKICLTPPYDVPAGFSETYHAALMRHEVIWTGGLAGIPPCPPHEPALERPAKPTAVEPPLEW